MSSSKDQMVIAHISEDGRGGGQLQYISDIVEDQSYTQIIICPKEDNRYQSAWNKEKVRHIPLRLTTISMGITNIIGYLLSFIPDLVKLSSTYHRERVSLVVCHSATQFKGIIAAYISRIPRVWVMHDTFLPKSARLVFRIMSTLCTNYIYVSKRSEEYYTKMFSHLNAQDKSVIPSSIDHNKFSPGGSNCLPKDSFNVLTVCYINKWKGLELLVDIADHLTQIRKNDIVFHVVGPVLKSRIPYMNKLKESIEEKHLENIIFHGPSDNISDFLRAADMFLCTSTYESSPISLWEAMSTGKYILSTDVGDVKDIFEEYKCGKVITDRNALTFANAILYAKDNKAEATQISNDARMVAINLFDKKRLSKDHLDLYIKILSDS